MAQSSLLANSLRTLFLKDGSLTRNITLRYNSSSSSSSYRAGSTDIPDPLSPLLPIVHHPR